MTKLMIDLRLLQEQAFAADIMAYYYSIVCVRWLQTGTFKKQSKLRRCDLFPLPQNHQPAFAKSHKEVIKQLKASSFRAAHIVSGSIVLYLIVL